MFSLSNDKSVISKVLSCGLFHIVPIKLRSIFHPVVVDMVQRTVDAGKILEYVNSAYTDLKMDNCPNLEIKWILDNSIFKIETRDNAEILILIEDEKWIVA